MAVKVAFQDAPESATAANSSKPAASVIIPKSALQNQAGKSIVWVIQNGKVERRAVTVSQTTGDEVSLSAGVVAGETVVLKSPKPLSDGQRVTVTKP